MEVTQKIVTESRAPGCSFDKTGNICQHNSCVDVNVRDAEIRLKRGKWIWRDLWFGICQHREERRFSRVRDADQPDIGD